MKLVESFGKIGSRQAGQVLPMALVLLAASIFIIIPALYSAQISLGVNRDAAKDTSGYYAAEAGIADAVWKFKSSTAPFTPTGANSPYSLSGNPINGLNVTVTLLKYTYNTTTGTNNYFIKSSAMSGSATQAQIVALITQTGSSANDVFDKAAVSLNGDITMSGGCTIGTDDIVIIDDCDTAWTRIPASTHLTCATENSIIETGLYYDTSKSAKFTLAAAAVVENLAYRNTGTRNISGSDNISLWLRSTIALSQGDIQLVLATNTALGGTTAYLNVPAVPANTGTCVIFPNPGHASFSALKSIGIKQYREGAFTLYIDEVVATNNLNYGNIYANGNVSLQPSAMVYGDASATGTINVNTGAGARVWGTQTPDAPAYPAQAIDIAGYISQAQLGQHNPTLAGYGSFNLGPAYFDATKKDLTLNGSQDITLTGPIYVAGKLTIGGSVGLKGPYTIVADQIVITGGSGVQLAKAVMPFIIATSSKTGTSDPAFYMSGGPQISAIVYAPNGLAYISGGSGPSGYSVWGSVVAGSLLMDGSTSIKYLSGIRMMSQIPGPGIGGTASLERFDYQ